MQFFTSCLEHCLSLIALRLPFQCSSWKTVISSWNSSMVLPALDSSMNRKASTPALDWPCPSKGCKIILLSTWFQANCQLLSYPIVTVGLLHCLLDELWRDLSVGLLVEDGVHEGNPGCTAAGFCFGWAVLQHHFSDYVNFSMFWFCLPHSWQSMNLLVG